jgi:eukaryotic-like serine/threonine-protein kinase
VDDLRARLEHQLSAGYLIERELGGGGMSRTYLAYEHALGRRVVIKVLAPELLAGISVERFRREVLLAAGLQHPHVVPVLSAGDADGLPWFTMPYVDGDSLRHRLAEGPVTIGEAISILRDVARALVYAHRHGIVHRDIKPDNVLLSSGSATVTDFGIAKAIAASRTNGDKFGATLTQVGTSIGTPTYMSPEQALGDTTTDHRTDVYAFGVMAYELLAGRPPFRAESASKLVAAHLGEAPRDVAELRDDCPPMLGELVMRCLSKDPAHRPQQASDMVRLLETITSSASTASAPAILRGRQLSTTKAFGLWAATAAIVVLTAWAATSVIGLPDWVFPGAVGVMLAGLPVILFTAYAQHTARRTFMRSQPSAGSAPQHGTMATIALKVSPHLSWRQTWVGGGIAVGAFAALVIGYMVLRAAGIGPMASLRGKGAFSARETVVVGDFKGPSSDAELGPTLAEALRTDLGQSRALNVLSRATLRDMLRLMKREAESVVTFDLAREIATREGAKAVLDGEVVKVGGQYVVSARLVSALDATELATFREEATSENDLLPAMGRLSRAIRERAGESLRTIRASGELERVTTPSLPALRKYVEGSRIYADEGDADRAETLLKEAVALDSAFAMAWRRLAVVTRARGVSREEELDALSTAYRHRERLTETERVLTEATYFFLGPAPDRDRALAAYDQLIRLDSTNSTALNNSANLLRDKNDFQLAEQRLRVAIRAPTPFGGAFINLLNNQIDNRASTASLDSTVAALKARLPGNSNVWLAETQAAWGSSSYDRADSIAKAANARAKTLNDRMRSSSWLEELAMLRGEPGAAARWRGVASNALIGSSPSFSSRFALVIDTAQFEAFVAGDAGRTAAVIARGLSRVPMDSLAPSERPWLDLITVAADVQDTSLMRMAARGFLHDQLSLQFDTAGVRVRTDAYVAYAAGRWSDAIRLFNEAYERGAVAPQPYLRYVGTAHDRAGRPDSAMKYLEQFVSRKSANAYLFAPYLPRIHRRLGELYENSNDNAKAVRHYEAFVEYWKKAEPVFQPDVQDVRRRLERMRVKSG